MHCGTRKCIKIIGNENEGKNTLEIPIRKLELIKKKRFSRNVTQGCEADSPESVEAPVAGFC
jgi:hypothetical protein